MEFTAEHSTSDGRKRRQRLKRLHILILVKYARHLSKSDDRTLEARHCAYCAIEDST